MAEPFHPVPTILAYCRFCKKVMPATLDRSIAANGKTVDRDSTFEYYCSKCNRSFCFAGTDLLEDNAEKQDVGEPKDYSPKLHYLIGDVVFHKKFKEKGPVVAKESGTPACIVVNFEKSGMRKLVEDLVSK